MMAKRSGNHPIKGNLSSREFCCVIWATKGLSYDLIDDGLFRAQFAPCLPVGLNRKELSEEMKCLAQKILDLMFVKIGKGIVSLAVDGWTNCRHKKVKMKMAKGPINSINRPPGRLSD